MSEWVTQETLSSADFLAGAMILVDKPKGWTSFDVVNKIRSVLRHTLQVKKIKVGHAGTLDPMATGLLILCTGKLTPRLADLQGLDKEYTGTMNLGATTASYDAETPPENPKPIGHLAADDIGDAAAAFVGSIDQVPPMYSAIKLEGRPLYRAARKGETIERTPRQVFIASFDITAINLPEVAFRVRCSKGTYIRSLVHDLGERLGCGAYLTELRRTKIGSYKVEDAWQVEGFVEAIRN